MTGWWHRGLRNSPESCTIVCLTIFTRVGIYSGWGGGRRRRDRRARPTFSAPERGNILQVFTDLCLTEQENKLQEPFKICHRLLRTSTDQSLSVGSSNKIRGIIFTLLNSFLCIKHFCFKYTFFLKREHSHSLFMYFLLQRLNFLQAKGSLMSVQSNLSSSTFFLESVKLSFNYHLWLNLLITRE